ncbi:hypothetical protein FGRMN_3798 [Fusarium graminum]|nr:hypothetical protein FGRMN_3798 [Fusarium graminum]
MDLRKALKRFLSPENRAPDNPAFDPPALAPNMPVGDDLLCQPCQRIGLQDILSPQADELEWWSVASLRDFTLSRAQLLASKCQLCNLVGKLRAADLSFNQCRLEMSGIRFHDEDHRGERSAIVRLAVRSMNNKGADDVVRHLIGHSLTDPWPSEIRERQPRSIDFELFKKACQLCSENHQQCRYIDLPAGSDANYGLPGVSRERKVQTCLTIGRVKLIEAWDDGDDLIKHKREVIYLCNEAHLTETQSFNSSDSRMKETLRHFNWMIHPGDKRSKWTVKNQLGPHIEEYTARDLSNEDDSLNAVLGIFKHYESIPEYAAEPIKHLWGVPILEADSIQGDVLFLMFWKHREVATGRRLGFPSWSWAGWSGPIMLPTYSGRISTTVHPPSSRRSACRQSLTHEEDTPWYIGTSDNGHIGALGHYFRSNDKTVSDPTELHIAGLVVKMRFREIGSKVFATFPIGENAFLAVPVFLDRTLDLNIHKIGIVIPRGGGLTYTDCYMYNVIILQEAGKDRFERVGIVALECLGNGTFAIFGKLVLNERDETIDPRVKQVKYLFLGNAETRDILLI